MAADFVLAESWRNEDDECARLVIAIAVPMPAPKAANRSQRQANQRTSPLETAKSQTPGQLVLLIIDLGVYRTAPRQFTNRDIL
jgi:hypothetical protein